MTRLLKMQLALALALGLALGPSVHGQEPGRVAGADRVIVQGHFAAGRARKWTVYQNGVQKDQGTMEYFPVPRNQDLVIVEATFTVKGAAAEGANFQLTARNGVGCFPLARVTGKLSPELPASSILRKFSSGLTVAGGTELAAGLGELNAGSPAAPVEVLLYGYWVNRPK